MSWEISNYKARGVKDYNAVVRGMHGSLDDHEARLSLIQFLRHNIGITFELVTGWQLAPFQEIIMRSLMMRDNALYVAGRGCSKSLSYNKSSKVFSKTHGLISLPKLIPNIIFDKEKWIDIPETELWNGKKWATTTKVLVQPNKNCFKITTKNGYEIECSDNHLMKSLNTENNNSEIIWKRTRNMKVGDFLCISQNKLPNLTNEYKKHISNNNKNIIPGAKKVLLYLRNKYNIKEQEIKEPAQIELSYNKVIKFIDFFDSKRIEDPLLDNLKESIKENYFYDPIVSIEKLTSNCIDFNVPDGESYWANGFINHNSTIIAFLGLLYPVFYPKTKFCIVSANFRRSRAIMEEMNKILNSKGAELIASCFNNELRRMPDMFRWEIPVESGSKDIYSEVFALPLGEGIRGTRASVLCVDEGLLITENLQKNIIRPFLTARQDFTEEQKIKRAEDELIKLGSMKEEERTSFPANKYWIFSSASYDFEYLYETYNNWIKLSREGPNEDGTPPPSYYVNRMSYEAIPKDSFMDLSAIRSAEQDGGYDSPHFAREYRALFIGMGSSYFNPKRMEQCTVEDGDYPHILLRGKKKDRFILAIDPSYGEHDASDYFAMGVYKIPSSNEDNYESLTDTQKERLILVNSYARAGAGIREHYEYLCYILTCFDIRLLVIDNSGNEFIKGFNESTLAQSLNLKLDFMDISFNNPPSEEEYHKELKKAKKEYDYEQRKIVYGQNFTSKSIRTMNEHLQNWIEAKRVWFASRLCNHDNYIKQRADFTLPYKFKNNKGQRYDQTTFIDEQEALIGETKKQTALIEVKITTLGHHQYDLPQTLKRQTGANRPRRDNYTTLMMATWGAKFFFDFQKVEVQRDTGFMPCLIN